MSEAFGGLTPSDQVVCGRCGRVIAYDSGRSQWFDESGILGCAPGDDGELLEHDPQWSSPLEPDEDDV